MYNCRRNLKIWRNKIGKKKIKNVYQEIKLTR